MIEKYDSLSNNEYKFLKRNIGNAVIDLPSEWKELFILGRYGASGATHIDSTLTGHTIINRTMIKNAMEFSNIQELTYFGLFSLNDATITNSGISVCVTETQITNFVLKYKGTDITNTAIWEIYYR